MLALAALLTTGAASSDPAERLRDPAGEQRARAIFRETRCLVCQNESIDDSEADLAADLRGIIREQVAAGRTDAQVRRFLTDRYGRFVLFKPAFDLGNAALWLTPFAIVAAGGAGLLAARPTRGRRLEPPLTAQERDRLQRLAPGVTVRPQLRPTDATIAAEKAATAEATLSGERRPPDIQDRQTWP